MKVAIVGSRGISDIDFEKHLPLGIDCIISGGAKGVDSLAAKYASGKGIELVEILPDYAKFGRPAPLIRDKEIVEKCDELFAFWDGQSRGTKFTFEYAKKIGKPVHIIMCLE